MFVERVIFKRAGKNCLGNYIHKTEALGSGDGSSGCGASGGGGVSALPCC